MVRRMEAGDAAAVAALCREALGHDTTEACLKENIAAMKDNPSCYLCVCTADATSTEICGFLQAQTYDLVYGGKGWNIIALAVSAQSRGNGFGRQLVQALEAHARAGGAAFIRLNSRVERTDAHHFYEHLGYTCDKTQKRFIRYLNCV